MIPLHIILARDEANGIGRSGSIPWSCPRDMAFFRDVTTTTYNPFLKNTVVFGRNTWRTVPHLDGRYVRTMSRDGTFDVPDGTEHIFLGGGASSLRSYMYRCIKGDADFPETVILTRIPGEYDCDTRVDDLDIMLHRYEHLRTLDLGTCLVDVYAVPGLDPERFPRRIFLLLNGTEESCSS